MKKLLALLAVLGLVNVASAALSPNVSTVNGIDLRWEQVEGVFTNTVGTYDKFYLYYDASSYASVNGGNESPNALQIDVVGNANIGVAATPEIVDGVRNFLLYSASEMDDETFETVLKPTVGRSGVDVFDLSVYRVGQKLALPDPGKGGFFNANSFSVAFAQATGFTKLPNGTTTGQFATIYLLQGSEAQVTLLGGYGEGSKDDIASFAIPEPATLSLLAVGVVGLIRRKLA